MLGYHTPLEETYSYKELTGIGRKEGKKEGKKEGIKIGELKGKITNLRKIFEARTTPRKRIGCTGKRVTK